MTKKIVFALLAMLICGCQYILAQETWGNIEYQGDPWVRKMSRPNEIKHGLWNRHISIWASHGRYYDQGKGTWKWQRPNLFGTTEDLFTQTIVVPYLIPMLENAGAVVFTPRERDWQKNEIIIDNDNKTSFTYAESNGANKWETSPGKGFALHRGNYYDGENPFEAGTARLSKTTKKSKKTSLAFYQPTFSEAGRYAVYVSYQSVVGSVTDAEYIVIHQGRQTIFHVNQQMGGGTWVYLGTFDFDKGSDKNNRVIVSNLSEQDGYVTTDAVRFGGGMGNIQRGGTTSNYPRALEGARYSAQWSGAPYDVYSTREGSNDYADDINVRSLMTNWLAGGSVYIPTVTGRRVPIELTLAVHSDAGYNEDGKSVYGPLAICTTNHNDGKLNAGISRKASLNFAESLLSNAERDISYLYTPWQRRHLYDRNYSETRIPEVPSAIFETLSHQSFPDMRLGHDPNFKFTLARSIYKTILKYVAKQHGKSYVVQPLTPNHFRIEFTSKDKVKLSWNDVSDPLESTAKPSSYIVYTAIGKRGFDNGRPVKSEDISIELEAGVPYHFKVTAVNDGGESFPTEVLSALYQPEATRTVLVVNGFHRLAAPAFIDNDTIQGFDLYSDPGVSYGLTAGWNGTQQCFDKSKMGIEGPGGLGYGGDELAGHFIAGNTFDYVKTHVEAIASARKYNVVSCSKEAFESEDIHLKRYDCIDLLLGLEKNDKGALVQYKAFSPQMQQMIGKFIERHGALIVSGAYIGTDMQTPTERAFLNNVLKLDLGGTVREFTDDKINGLGMNFDIYRSLNDKHYSATSTDILHPISPAYCAMQYANGSSAGVAYNGNDYKCFVMGFPFECIKSAKTQESIMRGVLNFVMR